MALVLYPPSVHAVDGEEWQTLYTIGRFHNADPPKADQVFKIMYRTSNGTIENFDTPYHEVIHGVEANLTSSTEGILEIRYPRNYPYTNYTFENVDGSNAILFVNGEELITEDYYVLTDCFFEFSIPFIGSTEIEIGFAIIPVDSPFHGDDVPEHCIPETTTTRPIHQVLAGIAVEDVVCPESFQLVISLHNKPYCVTPNSLEILKERWHL